MTASAVIGRSGGVLSLGGFSMRVPKGAVPKPTLFTLTVPASRYLEVEINAGSEEHYQFLRPVMVTLDYSRCAVDLGRVPLSAWYIDSETKAPLAEMRSHDDKGRHRVTFETGHLSGYAIAN